MALPASVVEVCDRIADASDDAALVAAVGSARRVVVEARRDGIPATRLAASWSAIARTAIASATQFGVPAGGSDITWFVSGSTARDEALPGSDVESLLSIDDRTDPAIAMAHAASVHAILDRCRLRGDDKGAIGSRARFCRTDTQWTEGIKSWTSAPHADRGVVMAGLLADSRSVTDGDDVLARRLGENIRKYDRALPVMLSDALAVRAPTSWRLRIFAGGDDAMDLKAAAIEPVVQIARWAALSCGSTALRTVDRLTDASGTKFLDADDAKVLRECYTIATRIRWHHRAPAWLDKQPFREELTLSELPPHDRALLRGVGREINGIRRKLTYLASTSSFG